MFSSIKVSEKVRRGEDGGGGSSFDDVDGWKKTLLIPFLGIVELLLLLNEIFFSVLWFDLVFEVVAVVVVEIIL
jgi:hypothetical protein